MGKKSYLGHFCIWCECSLRNPKNPSNVTQFMDAEMAPTDGGAIMLHTTSRSYLNHDNGRA